MQKLTVISTAVLSCLIATLGAAVAAPTNTLFLVITTTQGPITTVQVGTFNDNAACEAAAKTVRVPVGGSPNFGAYGVCVVSKN